MGKVRDKLKGVRFHCAGCDERFEAEPDRIDDAPEDAWHPWRYFAACPTCGEEAVQDRQHRHLLKMWANATGPKTAEGKAASAANLEGHPTPEEARRTRFNALQTGLHAKTATYWPARPGQYPHCKGCGYFDTCHTQVACLKRTDLLLQHQIAFETGDPSLLTDLRAQLHANVQALLDDMILALAQDGVRIKSREWYYSPDGKLHFVSYEDEDGVEHPIMKIEQHPLLRTLGDMISKLNLGLADQGMTPRSIDDADVIRGQLDSKAADSADALEYQERQTKALESLAGMVERARAKANVDPVLVEHQERREG